MGEHAVEPVGSTHRLIRDGEGVAPTGICHDVTGLKGAVDVGTCAEPDQRCPGGHPAKLLEPLNHVHDLRIV